MSIEIIDVLINTIPDVRFKGAVEEYCNSMNIFLRGYAFEHDTGRIIMVLQGEDDIKLHQITRRLYTLIKGKV